MDEEPGPSRMLQLAHVATEHYIRGRTRIEIAESMRLSRFKVGRLLDEAIRTGIVTFQIASPSRISLDASMRLKERFGLDHAVAVVVSEDAPAELQRSLGDTAADLLREILTADDVLGVTSGRTLNAMARSLPTLPCGQVVQLAGVAGPIQHTGLEVMRRLSTLESVRPWPIYSSLVMSDRQAAAGVLRQPDVRQTFSRFPRVSVAVMAIGSWVPQDSMMCDNRALTPRDKEALLARGVVAETAATLVTDAGQVIHDIDDRTIAISEQQLRSIETRIAVAGGASKTRAIRAVLTAGLLTGLVTDTGTVERLLAA